MTDLILHGNNKVATMTSREIAELTEKRHDNVMRTIETLYEKSVIGLPQFEEVPNPGFGPLLLQQYLIGKRDSFIVVAQLSPEFTARLVDRWQELETEKAKPAELSRMDILKLAVDSEQRAIDAEAQLKLAAPAIAHMEAVQSSRDDFTFQEMAHILQEHGYRLGRNRLMDVLRRAGVLGKTSNLPMQDYRERGYFRVVESIRESASGRKHVDLTTYVTGKGHNWLTKAMDTLLQRSEKVGGAA